MKCILDLFNSKNSLWWDWPWTGTGKTYDYGYLLRVKKVLDKDTIMFDEEFESKEDGVFESKEEHHMNFCDGMTEFVISNPRRKYSIPVLIVGVTEVTEF